MASVLSGVNLINQPATNLGLASKWYLTFFLSFFFSEASQIGQHSFGNHFKLCGLHLNWSIRCARTQLQSYGKQLGLKNIQKEDENLTKVMKNTSSWQFEQSYKKWHRKSQAILGILVVKFHVKVSGNSCSHFVEFGIYCSFEGCSSSKTIQLSCNWTSLC